MTALLRKIAFLALAVYAVQADETKHTFSLIHFGDINGQLLTYERGTEPPIPFKSGHGDPAGGLGKLSGAMKIFESNVTHTVIRISTGNLVGGAWLSSLGWKNYSGILESTYKPRFLGFGFNEFEAGLVKTNEYLNFTNPENQTAIITNIGNSGDRASLKNVNEYGSFELGNNSSSKITIGVVGFVHPLVMNLSDPGNLIFDDVVTALDRVIKSHSNVKSFIAIGSGDSTLAKAILGIPKVKLVMYSDVHGSVDDKRYPEVLGDPGNSGIGKYIAYSSSLKYGGSIGTLTFNVAEDGNFELVTNGTGLVKIDGTNEDPEAEKIVKDFDKYLEEQGVFTWVASTLVNLDGTKDACWRSECNLGNLVADAMVDCAVTNFSNLSLAVDELIGVVAIWHSGAIFDGQIDLSPTEPAYIDVTDINRWFPYSNMAYLVSMKGSVLRQMFTTSGQGITAINTDEDWGQFLQVSNGLEVSYSRSGELQSLKTLRVNDTKPYFVEVENELNYQVIMPSVLYNGRNAYGFLRGTFGDKFKKVGSDDECLLYYIEKSGVLKNGFENRITIENPSPCPACKGSNTATTVVLTLVIFIVLVATALGLWLFAWPRFQTWRRTSSYP